MNELKLLRNKIKYRSSYRGTKEMDILLSSFVSTIINVLSIAELKKLNEFITCDDEDIYNFYVNENPISSFNDKKILDLFRNFKA